MSYFDDASLVMIPSGYKDQKVYSVKPIDGSGDLAFTRSNDTATRVGPDGLIEKVRTNIVLYSEQFDNAYWTKSQATITANATTAPDGTLTAEKFIEGSGSVAPECSRTPIATSNSIFTLSVFAKASERNFLIINNNDGTGSFRVWFNLTTGVIGTTDAGVTAFIENVGNGWFRCGVARQITVFASATSAFQIGSADGVDTYTGDGTSGIFIWGAQMELSDFGPTDYIATTTAAVSVGPVANLPRLDYSGGASCPKLLLEPQRVNLAQFSESFNNAYWTQNATVTANSTISPSGYQDADTLTDASNSYLDVRRSFTITASTAYTFSTFVKKTTGTLTNYAGIGFSGGGGVETGYAIFNTTTGVVNLADIAGGFVLSAKSTSYGDYYRFEMTFTTGQTSLLVLIYPALSQNGTTLSSDAQGSNVFWGAQLEAAAYATSYIPTLGAAVTRGADAASKTSVSVL
jgi:hypothetical protein